MPNPPMSRSSKKLRRILKSLGIDYSYLKVERTHAGRNQRSEGWVVWLAYDERNRIICGSCTPLRDLKFGETVKYPSEHETALEIGPK
jgi:hypothetical protein